MAQQHHRILDQVGDLLDQRRLGGGVDGAALGVGQRRRLLQDQLPSGGPVIGDPVVGHHRGVARGLGEAGGGRVIVAQQAGGPATGQIAEGEGDDGVTEQRHQPAQRPAEGDLGARPPTHGALEMQRLDRLGEQLRQHVEGGAARLDPLGHEEGVSAFVDPAQVGDRQALFAGEPGRRGRGLARGVEGPVGSGAFHGDGAVRLGRGDVGDARHDPPGGSVDLDGAVFQASCAEECLEGDAQLLAGRVQVRGRELLGSDLEEERGGPSGVGSCDGAVGPGFEGRWGLGGLWGGGRGGDAEGVAELLAPFDPQLGHVVGHPAHPGERPGPLRGTDGASGVQHVERLRALEDVVVGGHGQAFGKQRRRFRLVDLEQLALGRHIGLVQVVGAHFQLRLGVDLAVADPVREHDVLEVVDALEGHEDALQAVGDLHRDRVERQAPRGLEIGELGDLQPVQPHLPAEAPCAQGRGFPVVLDEAHVVAGGVDAEGPDAAQVQLLGIARIGLQDDLELGVGLEPVGVFAVATVVGPDARLHVGGAPRFRAEDPQERGRVQGARTHLGVERLGQHRAVPDPVGREAEDGVLHGEHPGKVPGAGALLSSLEIPRVPRYAE